MSFTQFAQEKDAASFRTAFQEAIQSAIADELEQQKFAIAQSMFGDQIEEEYDEDEMSDEELDEYLDSLSDEELEALAEEAEQKRQPASRMRVPDEIKAAMEKKHGPGKTKYVRWGYSSPTMNGSQLNIHHTVSRKAAGFSGSIRHEYSVGKNGKLKPSSYRYSFV